jgi:acetate kinase
LIPINARILTINGSSSSIKFAVFQYTSLIKKVIEGSINKIGLNGTSFTFSNLNSSQKTTFSIASANHQSAANYLLDWLALPDKFSSVLSIGHCIVEVMRCHMSVIVIQALLDELISISLYESDHLPAEIKLIEALD